MSMPEDIAGTLIFLLLIMVIVVVGGLAVMLKGANAGISYSVEFVPLANKPFMLSEVMSRMQMSDRTIMEQAAETAITGSIESANAVHMIDEVRVLMNAYKLRNYKVSIESNSNEIISIDGMGSKCGEKGKGWCSSSCDVGFVQVDSAGACTPSLVCCSFDLNAYSSANPAKTAIQCGGAGVCSEGLTSNQYILSPFPMRYQIGPYCGPGQQEIETDECKDANEGKTTICCAQKTDNAVSNTLNRARVPILFKNGVLGFLNVEVGIE